MLMWLFSNDPCVFMSCDIKHCPMTDYPAA